jgi:hypothetical protein
MMTTTMLLDPFIKFQSWVILVWNGVNAKRFRIVAKDLTQKFQNIVLTPKTTTFVANAILYLVDIKQEVVPKCVDLNFVHRFVQFV